MALVGLSITRLGGPRYVYTMCSILMYCKLVYDQIAIVATDDNAIQQKWVLEKQD